MNMIEFLEQMAHLWQCEYYFAKHPTAYHMHDHINSFFCDEFIEYYNQCPEWMRLRSYQEDLKSDEIPFDPEIFPEA
jgi:hypothetical protein